MPHKRSVLQVFTFIQLQIEIVKNTTQNNDKRKKCETKVSKSNLLSGT